MTTNICLQKLLKLENEDSQLFKTQKIALIKVVYDYTFTEVSEPNEKHEQKMSLREAFSGRVSEQDIDKYLSDWSNSHGKRCIDAMKKCEFVLFFIPEKKDQARFVALYKINCFTEEKESTLFDFERINDFKNLEGRVVVTWLGDRPVSQYWTKENKGKSLNEKFVLYIDDGLKRNTRKFISYQDVVLSYKDLCAVVEDKEWQSRLKIVNCIYCIVNRLEGRLYIGSTYGKNGILERWKEYAKEGHGNNKKLKELINEDKVDPNNFQWFILEILPLSVNEVEAVGRENFYKEKFCTRDCGYNIYESNKKGK